MKQIAFWDEVLNRPACLLVPAALLTPPVDAQALHDYRMARRTDWQPSPAPAAPVTE